MPLGPAWLVLPTYNEAASLARVARAADRVLQDAGPRGGHRILVVDDASPDGTGQLAERLAAELAAVEVLRRAGKAGLGQAYLAGFERALAGGARVILTMDADGSHDPADLTRLLAAARRADLVLGSRYVPGGQVRDWGLPRRVLSRSGCWYAQRVLGVAIADLTGGFKCVRREVLESIDLASVRSQGYAFQVELTYRALRRGFRVQELPIAFRDRRDGTSKMTSAIALEALWRVPQMRWRASQAERPSSSAPPSPLGTILSEARRARHPSR